MSSSSRDSRPAPDGRLSIRHWPLTSRRPNRWVSVFWPSGAGMYWPVALTAPSSFAVISTIEVFCEFSCGGSTDDTVGAWEITVTAGPGPGCHAELAAGVRYCRAIAWPWL